MLLAFAASLVDAATPSAYCQAMAKYRDEDLVRAFDHYRNTYQEFGVRHDQLEHISSQLDASWWGAGQKTIQAVDAITLAFQVTVEVLLQVMPSNPSKVVHVVRPAAWKQKIAHKALEDAVKRMRKSKGEAEPVEGDLRDLVREKALGKSPDASEVIQGAFKSWSVLQTLLNAQKRIEGRGDRIKEFENAVRDARTALAEVRTHFDAVVKQTNLLNDIRQEIDRECGGVTAADLNAFVPDAKSCIEIGRDLQYKGDKKRKRYMANNCDRDVIVFWCIEIDGSPKCNDVKLYAKWTKLKPNEKYFNSYSLPSGPRVQFGACYGRYKNAKFTKDGSGDYGCLP